MSSSWLARAWGKYDCEPEDCFEPFIYTWISFNGWASCVTGLDSDYEWIDALMQSQSIIDDFAQLTADEKSNFSVHAKKFYQLWPIFKELEIRRRRVSIYSADNRQEVIKHYLKAGVENFQPKCWTRHHDEGSTIPIDWPHCLKALYRVRCNLFHGEKSAHSKMDAHITSSAFRVLINFLKETKYIT